METGSVLSEPVNYPHLRGFPKERSASMTIISPKSGQPRMSQLENLEAKMASIEVSLSTANPARRRKGTSLGGGISIIGSNSFVKSSPRITTESKEIRTAVQDREAVIQNLRIQLGLGKLPRPTGPPLDDSEKPQAEQKLARLKIDADNKRIAIRNLKSALDKLDITDNIDIRIRQAELEYALGREELQLLSIVEEARALQTRLEKSKPESNSLFSIISSGVNLTLHAVQATTGRWAANTKSDSLGLFIEWALDGEGLYRGDRILEVNGKIITCRTKEELQKIIGTIGKCQLVVLRKKSTGIPSHQQLLQQQEDNQRLQHRISYLEEQVRELQTSKESSPPPISLQNKSPSPSSSNSSTMSSQHQSSGMNGNGLLGHVTSISISSPPSSPEKPQVFQRGNYVTTLVGGKPIELTGSNTISSAKSHHITKTLIKENGHYTDTENNYVLPPKSLSASKISINSDLLPNHIQLNKYRERDRRERIARNNAINNGKIHGDYNGNGKINGDYNGNGNINGYYHGKNIHARSVEHLNFNGVDKRKEIRNEIRKYGNDLRSVKSLDFESDNDTHYGNQSQYSSTPQQYQHHHIQQKRNTDYTSDYTSEPVAPIRVRPTPPKKPLRLSLQRAQSLQTVELFPGSNHENDKKRSLKRVHKSNDSNLIENASPLHTASLGRHKHI